MRHAKKAATIWVQNDFCARVKGASDKHPVTYKDPVTEKETTHGTADGRAACLHHCLSVGLAAQAPASRSMFVLASSLPAWRSGVRQMSCMAGA